jgi:hypothetical protein
MRRLTAPGSLAPAPLAASVLAASVLAASVLAGCAGTETHSSTATVSIPARLLAGMRPIGAGIRFRPRVTGRPTGGCSARPGDAEAHLELFAANQVLLIRGGVGHRGDCYGNAVTTDPTGVVHFRPGATLADLFRAWGEPLTPTRLASFAGPVRYYVAGRRVHWVPALREHTEIVIEVGPYVPPHSSFSFSPGL